MKIPILAVIAVLAGASAAAAQTNRPFQPLPTYGQANAANGSYQLAAGTTSTPFQLPAVASPPLPAVSVSIVNLGSNVVWVATGPTQASVASLTIPAAGSGTIGAVGNARPVNPGNNVVYTFGDGWWFNIQTSSGTSNVQIEAGTGN